MILSEIFNFHFVMAWPNPMDSFWGAADVRAWDGGFFGVLGWAAIALTGSIAMDGILRLARTRMIRVVLISCTVAMMLGWGLSCLSTCCDVKADFTSPVPKVAENLVVPPF